MSTGSTGWNPDDLNDTRVGSCILEDPLSISSIGAVFLARQEHPHRQVAVKVIHRQLVPDLETWQFFLARFQREADATATLEHANIVPIYEFGETGDLAYLVMPYFPDGSLATRLEQQGPLSIAQTVRAVEQVAAALDYAHARGIIHRDVKPSNMLLHPDGRVVLADFGIAHPLHVPDLTAGSAKGPSGTGRDAALTETGMVMGTPEYMSPEQVRGNPLTPASDLYGLGIAAYELLSGQTPFEGGDVPTVLRRQVASPPPPLRTLHPDLPARVEGVIFWALSKDPAKRPTSAGQFAQALRSAAETSSRVDSLPPPVPVLSEATLPQLNNVLPPLPGEPKLASDETYGDEDSSLAGPDSFNQKWVVLPSGGMGNYTSQTVPGAPQWRLPRPGPDRRVAIAAVVGLALAIVGLLTAAAYVVNSVQSAHTSPSGAPAGAISSTASPFSERATLSPLPTATTISPSSTASAGTPTSASGTPTATSRTPTPNSGTPTPIPRTPTPTTSPLTNWLVVSPTQIMLACPPSPGVTLRLTNTGPQTVSWVEQTNPPNPGLTVQPASGVLSAGATQTIMVSIIIKKSKPTQGTLLFRVVSGQQAGNPAQVTYTIGPCV